MEFLAGALVLAIGIIIGAAIHSMGVANAKKEDI